MNSYHFELFRLLKGWKSAYGPSSYDAERVVALIHVVMHGNVCVAFVVGVSAIYPVCY